MRIYKKNLPDEVEIWKMKANALVCRYLPSISLASREIEWFNGCYLTNCTNIFQ